MTKPIRVGIVGTNANRAWAHDAHIPALKNLRQFSIVAVSARTQTLAEEARRAFDVPRGFGDSFELVRDPEVDLVTVTVKVPEHRAVVLAALDAGKHVYCEWPLGRDLDEALELQAAVRPGSHVAIGFQGISAPAVRRAADIVQSGALGQLRVLRMFSPTAGWGADAPPFFAYLQDKKNGATLETIAGGHSLAIIEAIVGKYLEVQARNSILCPQVRIRGTDEFLERSCADHMLVLGRHETGCISTLEVMGGTAKPFAFELTGEQGWLKLTSDGLGGFQVGQLKLETSVEIAPFSDATIGNLAGPPINVAEAYLRFADDILEDARTVPDFAYAVRLTRLLDSIVLASEQGNRQLIQF